MVTLNANPGHWLTQTNLDDEAHRVFALVVYMPDDGDPNDWQNVADDYKVQWETEHATTEEASEDEGEEIFYDVPVRPGGGGGDCDCASLIVELQRKVEEIEAGEKFDTSHFATKDELNDLPITLSLNELAKKTEVAQLAENVAQKQNQLIPGSGIKINGNEISADIDNKLFKIVTALPENEADIDPDKQYLLINELQDGQIELLQHVWLNGKWKQLGKIDAELDLSGYVDKAELEAYKAQVDERIAAAIETASAIDIDAIVKTVAGRVNSSGVPIGQVIFLDTEDYPGDLFGYGKWKRIAQGMFIVGEGINIDKHDYVKQFKAGANAGEYRHQITVNEMPKHYHHYAVSNDRIGNPNGARDTNSGNNSERNYWRGNQSLVANQTTYSTGGGVNHSSSEKGKTGNGTWMEYIQPTYGLYAWLRIE